MAISLKNHDNLLVIHITDIFKSTEFEKIKKNVLATSQNFEKVNVLAIIQDGFVSLEDGINWAHNDSDEHIQKKVRKLAIVGDFKWKEKAFLFLLKGLVPVSIEYFPPEHKELADAWVND